MEFQFLTVDAEGQPLYRKVMHQVAQWGTSSDTMFVVGATRPEILRDVRAAHPTHFFLVPGVGAQGGDLRSVMEGGLTADGGLLINNSRGILYAGKGEEAIPAARRAAIQMQQAMQEVLRARGVI